MIEYCKTIAVNIFWVLAAATEILLVTGVILAVVDRIINSRSEEENHEETD